MNIWAKQSLRFMRQHLGQTLLTVLGIALGVAAVVAVDLANSSARRSFALSLQALTGPSTHFLSGGPSGINEVLYPRLRRELGLDKVAPRIQASVRVQGLTFTLLGMDILAEQAMQRHRFIGLGSNKLSKLFQDPNRVVLERRSARNLQLEEGDSFELRYQGHTTRVYLGSTFVSPNPAASEGIIFADLSVVQEILGRLGTLDRIDMILSPRQYQSLSHWLPDSVRLVEAGSRNRSLQQMSESFHINLAAMSLLALLVSALLIYNTLTFSVLRRRSQLGILRSLGQTPRELFSMILVEALALGVIGTLLGILLGLAIGQSLVNLVTRTINDLYFVLSVREVFLDPFSLLKGGVLGLGMTLLAALLPARAAASTRPITVQQRSSLEQQWRRQLPRLSLCGSGLLAAGFGLLQISTLTLVMGFCALTLLVLGFSLLIPLLVLAASRLALKLFKPWLRGPYIFALRGIGANLSRTGLAVAALCVAVSATVGVNIMITSFRATVNTWLEQTLAGDVYISTPGRASSRGSPGLPPELISQLTQLPEIAGYSSARTVEVETEYGLQRLWAVTNSAHQSRPTLLQSVEAALLRFSRGEGVLISEPFAYHQQLSTADTLTLFSPGGAIELPVLGVFRDYRSSRGLITLSQTFYQRHWQDFGLSTLALYGTEQSSQQTLLQTVRSITRAQPGEILVSSNRELRQTSMTIFDRTFAVTHVLRMLTIVVALIGILSALLSIQLEQKKQFAILRACGTTPRQMIGAILLQTTVLGAISGILALPLGWLMSEVLIDVINRSAFGWSMDHLFPPLVIGEALGLALIAALLAGLYPAWHTSRANIAGALRHE
ncbi:MAG: ABC transporter permease [Candidatus Reddybacter sp.]